jgi:asparagine synthase (glutamine-hydrolysing)
MNADAWVVLVGDDAGALRDLSARVGRRLAGGGWTRRLDRPFLQVLAPAKSWIEISEGFDGHGVLIGEMFGQDGRRLTAQARGALACRALDAAGAAEVVAKGWGRYVLVRRTAGEAAVLRDPSGAVEAVLWRKAGVTVIAPRAPSILDALLPDDLEIDWTVLKRLVGAGGSYSHRLALTGLTPVAAGQLAAVGPAGVRTRQIWRPAEVYRTARSRPRPNLRTEVDGAVRALAGDHAWVVEVSGGLDSAIVVGGLDERQRSRVAAWVNHFADQPEGDERGFARPVVERHGFALTEVRRQGLALSAARLARSADGFRPAINDLDLDYNDDIATRIEAAGAWGSLTGQGGDAVFFQMPSFLIAMDEIREQGLRARGRVLHRIAKWTGHSLWPGAWLRAVRAHQRERTVWDHPWLEDLKGVPPGKALQISALVRCQTFQGQALRSRNGACVNPLLSQPVMEAGLAWSSVDLTWGGRDRAAARAAYRDILPPAVFARRSKGELGAFYGEAVAETLAFLRPWLLEGELAKAGVLDPALAEDLTREALLWRGGFSRLLSLALTEAWLRRWQRRIAGRRA